MQPTLPMGVSLSLILLTLTTAEPVDVLVGASVASDSIDRGASDFEGRPALSPQVVLTLPELGLEVGTALNLALFRRAEVLSDGATKCSELDELSGWVALTRELGPLSLSAGAITYQLVSAEAWPNEGASRLELATSAELPDVLPFVPRLDLFWDPADTGADGLYAKLSLTVSPLEAVSVTAHAGATTQNSQPEPGLADVGLSLAWELVESGVGVVPCAGVMWAVAPFDGSPSWLAFAGTELRFATGD